MKILMVHAGTPLQKNKPINEEEYLYRLSLEDSQYYYFNKKEIINADSQMQSLIKAGVDVHYGYTRNVKNPIRLFKLVVQIRKIVKKEKIELVHVLWGNILGLTVNFASPAPVLMSLCGSDLIGSYNSKLEKRFAGKVSGILTQIASVFSDRIITKSQDMKNRLWGISKKKTVVLPNGVDLSKFYPIDLSTSRMRLGWNLNNPILIFFYTDGQYMKNERLALKVYEKIRNKIPNCELKILSKVPHEDLIYYYNAANVLLNTSFHEGSNNSIKEAICCNLPVVAVPCGDAGERLKNIDNSFVSQGWDENELSNLIFTVLSSNKRSNGSLIASEISEDIIQQKLINIYHSIISG